MIVTTHNIDYRHMKRNKMYGKSVNHCPNWCHLLSIVVRLQRGLSPPTRWRSVRAWRTGPQRLTSPTSRTLTRRRINRLHWCDFFAFLQSQRRFITARYEPSVIISLIGYWGYRFIPNACELDSSCVCESFCWILRSNEHVCIILKELFIRNWTLPPFSTQYSCSDE